MPFQWNLLAWAALVGATTGLAVVGFHLLFSFFNAFLFGPFIEGLLVVGRAPWPTTPPLPPPEPAVPLSLEPGTPLSALLEIGLGGIGFLPQPPAAPAPAITAPSLGPGWLSLWPVVVVPTLGGLVVGLLRHLVGDLGPGLPSLRAMADGVLSGEPRLPFSRLLTAALSLGCGASLGPEGPSVESGGNLGLWMARRGRLSAQPRGALVACGVAAGLAAGFRAPIAGVFFAFEGSFSSLPGRPSLRAVLVSAVASTLVTQVCLGDEPILRLPAYEVRSPLELPLYLGLGLLASLMSWLLIRLLALGRQARLQRWMGHLPPGLATALGGAVVGGLALVFPQVLGVGYDTIEALLGREGGIALSTLLALIAVKLVATTISNATGFVGGGFAPSLFLGAVLGNLYGQLLGEQGLGLTVAEPPAYAMVGMAAVLAGSARAPLTALLLLFELTRDIRIVLPLMAAAGLSAALVERWLGMHDPGLLGPDPIEEGRRQRLQQLAVEEALEPEPPLVIPGDVRPSEALDRLLANHRHCLIVAEHGSAVGLITLEDLAGALSATQASEETMRLRDCLRSDLVWLPLGASLEELEDQLRPNDLRQIPVFDISSERTGRLPHGLPRNGLKLERLRGLASRDGMARALARHSQGL